MTENQKIFESGRFFTGCNYWASHAGTNMWHDWNAEVCEADLKRLAEANVKVMRMFPLWSDFQPLRMHRSGGGSERELRLYEDPLPFTEAGRAGVDEVMADRFGVFCDLAEKYGIKLIVGLITGWMSGRMYMPEAFAGRSLITDPMVVRWQVRFVRYMVKRFKNHPAIAAWDLGNECNCLQSVSRDAAYCWVAQITNAIRMEDLSHPVVSGMHSLRPEGAWTPEDQGELLDVLCTHPYPIFTPHCDTDPINEMKTILHATCETLMYHDLSGGKDSFIEEAGTLGPMIAEDSVAADYIRASMFSSWAHDLRGFIWWCANEQSALAHTPYDWCAVERELGLFRINGEKKPVLNEMTKFTDFVDALAAGRYTGEGKPFKLPEPIKDAVCILTEGQDQWAAAFGTFLLAKQAGLDITFAWQNDEIPDSPAYIIPAITGTIGIRRHTMNLLIERVKNGAKLYLSLSEALMSPFNEITGVKVKTRSRRVREDIVKLDGYEFHLWNNMKYALASVGADVIAADANGEPAFTEYTLGKGKVYFCAFPIEMDASCKNGVISGQYAIPYYRFYKKLDMRNPLKTASCDCPYYSLTEHILDNGRLVTVLNCTPEARSELVKLDGEFVREINCHGGKCEVTADGVLVTLPANSGIAFMTK